MICITVQCNATPVYVREPLRASVVVLGPRGLVSRLRKIPRTSHAPHKQPSIRSVSEALLCVLQQVETVVALQSDALTMMMASLRKMTSAPARVGASRFRWHSDSSMSRSALVNSAYVICKTPASSSFIRARIPGEQG